MKFLFFAVALAALPLNADAAVSDQMLRGLADDFDNYKKEPLKPSFNATLFTGYVTGIASALSVQKLICIPPNTKSIEVNTAISAYIHDHPKDFDVGEGALIVMLGLREIYPCKN